MFWKKDEFQEYLDKECAKRKSISLIWRLELKGSGLRYIEMWIKQYGERAMRALISVMGFYELRACHLKFSEVWHICDDLQCYNADHLYLLR